MRLTPPNRNPHNLTIDTTVFVLSLSEDKHFSVQKPRAPLKPSEARGMLQEILAGLPPTWILHQEQVVELRQVVTGIIARSLRVLDNHERPKPDQIYLDDEEIRNAQEFLSYLDALNNELISHPEREDVIYGAPGCSDAEAAISLANSIRDEVRARVGSDEFRDTLFSCFALACFNPHGANNVIHCDSHFERIREILESHVSMLVRTNPKDYKALPEPQKILLQNFASSNTDRRKKTPVLKLPHFVNLMEFKFKTDILDQKVKSLMADKFPAPTID